MKQFFFSAILILTGLCSFCQDRFPRHVLSINGFRNPSIGLEYQQRRMSVHAGFYTTAFASGEYTNFLKTGVSFWFLAVDRKAVPSSFYTGVSYLRGLNRGYKKQNAFGFEAGFRWTIWKGLNVRLGAIALTAKEHSLKINPTPGISYSIIL